jgi:hypothetical protein
MKFEKREGEIETVKKGYEMRKRACQVVKSGLGKGFSLLFH